jgi:hypothetical protein
VSSGDHSYHSHPIRADEARELAGNLKRPDLQQALRAYTQTDETPDVPFLGGSDNADWANANTMWTIFRDAFARGASFNHDSAMRNQTALSLGVIALSDCCRHSSALSRNSSAVLMGGSW